MEKIKNNETHCPSCGKFVGTYERCPYCGTEVTKRISLKVFKMGSLVVALFGVLFLYLAAVNRQIPELEFDKVSETMNFAFVRIDGVVGDMPKVYYSDINNKPNSMSFTLVKGDHMVRVMAYSAVAEKIIDADKLPIKGENVQVSGSLRVREGGDSLALYIQAPEHLVVEKKDILEKNFWEIEKNDLNKMVKIKGYLVDLVESPANYPGHITITSKSGERGEITVWNKDIKLIKNTASMPDTPNLVPGSEVEVDVFVQDYKGKLQLMLQRPSDFMLTGNVETEIKTSKEVDGEITKADLGKTVSFKGVVNTKFVLGGLEKLVVDYNYGSIDVILFKSVLDELEQPINEGYNVSVTGKVDEYKGTIQVQLDSGIDIQIIGNSGVVKKKSTYKKPTTKKKYEKKDVPMHQGAVTTADKDKIIALKGTVSNKKELGNGVKYDFTYNDGNKITLLLWGSLLKYKQQLKDLPDGTNLEVNGKVEEYKGELELVPNHSANVTLLDKIDIIAKEVSGELTSANKGQIMTLEGRVYNKKDLGKGVKYILKYNGGNSEIALLMWKSGIKNNPSLEKLSDGQWIKVTGKIEEYKGTLEIIPKNDKNVEVGGN